MCGWVIFVFSLLHAFVHLCNFAAILVYDTEPGGVNEQNCTLSEMLLTQCPQKLGLVGGWANPTGIILILILALMVVCSQPFVRKSGYFEVFYWTHLLYIVFFTLTILHGPNFWKWFVAPGVLFLVERTHRTVSMRTGHGRTYISSGVLLPSKVINLVIQRPANFHFHPGDYVFVNIPTIAKYEWHPFTVSSAPEQDGALWLHIRAVGEWTNRLHSYFQAQQQKCTPPRDSVQITKLPIADASESSRPLEIVPMVAITEEETEPATETPPPTPQRKLAVVNAAFQSDENDIATTHVLAEMSLSDPLKYIKNKDSSQPIDITEIPVSPKAQHSTALVTTPVLVKKPGPQKIQSTPNFFVTKMQEKKMLDRSISVPNFYKKRSSKEEPKIIPSLTPRRTTSERRFDRSALETAQDLVSFDALAEARFLNSADKSVAQTYRYMRVKPTVITLDMPTDEEEDGSREAVVEGVDTVPEHNASAASGTGGKKKQVTVVTVEEPAKKANGHHGANVETRDTLAIPGEDDKDSKAADAGPRRTRFESRRVRRISRLEEAEALGQCIGEPLEIYIDGPYGAPSSHIFRAQHAVLIGTGIGVTPFASILQSIMHKYWKARHNCPKCEHSWSSDIPQSVMNLCKVDFFWINRDQRSFEWFVNLLSQLEIEQAEQQDGILDRFLDMHMYITSALQKTDMKAVGLQLALDLLHEKGKRDLITGLKTRTNAGRPNWDKVFKQLSSQGKGRITVFYCGPPALGRTLRYKCDEYGFNFRKEIF